MDEEKIDMQETEEINEVQPEEALPEPDVPEQVAVEQPKENPNKGLVPVSIAAAIIGMIVGTIPTVIVAAITGAVFSPLFVAQPLAIYLFVRLFKGCTGSAAGIVTAVFSLVGMYFTALGAMAGAQVREFGESFFSIPIVAATMMPESGLLSGIAFNSAYLYPLLFTVFGVLVTWQLYTRNGIKE